jgi:glycosyltransferase involved in cell wall biosynthesis
MKATTQTVLHITPHFGGGVGAVLLGYLERAGRNGRYAHKALCLDYANGKALEAARRTGFDLAERMAENPRATMRAIGDADIVLVHWWNHPLLYDLLVRQSLPPARIIMWSHVSGFHPPYVFTPPLLRYPDIVVFTTPLSLDTPEARYAEESVRHRFRTIWSTSGVEEARSVRPRDHDGFRVGYVGTVDYCKLHPNFLTLCGEVKIPGVHFVVCGGPYEAVLRKEAEDLGIGDRFTFTGQIDNVTDYLCTLDVFGYPLAPTHYGTCDQALAEAMAAGIPPVVMSNGMERYMVEDRVTGIVARDENAYCRAIEELYEKPGLHRSMSSRGRMAALRKFSLTRMALEWEQVFEEAAQLQKREREWTGARKGSNVSGADVFIESLGIYGEDFQQSLEANGRKERGDHDRRIGALARSSYNWTSETRGTVHHYHFFFSKDRYLRHWAGLMKPGQPNRQEGAH